MKSPSQQHLLNSLEGWPAEAVRAICERLNLSQQKFARRDCLNLRSLQNWEQGREPDDNVCALLRVIARYPDLAAKAQEVGVVKTPRRPPTPRQY